MPCFFYHYPFEAKHSKYIRQRHCQPTFRRDNGIGHGHLDFRLVPNPGGRQSLEYTLVGASECGGALCCRLLDDRSSAVLHQRECGVVRSGLTARTC